MTDIIDLSTETFPESPISDWIECLKFPEYYQRKALVQILSRWDEAAGPLLVALTESLDQADDADVDPADLDEIPFQAAYLFGHFRFKPAYPQLMRILRHPTAEDLVGDFLLEGLPKCLASCWTGDAQGLREVVLDREANEYARTAAWSALLCLAAWNERSAHDTIADLKDILRQADSLGSGFLAGSLAMSVTQLPPDAETIGFARAAFKDGHVELETYPVEEFEGELAAFEMADWQDRLAQLHGTRIEDASDEIEEWFKDENDEDVPDEPEWKPTAPVERLVADTIGRNDPCPCKSGMKYKKCCGKAA